MIHTTVRTKSYSNSLITQNVNNEIEPYIFENPIDAREKRFILRKESFIFYHYVIELERTSTAKYVNFKIIIFRNFNPNRIIYRLSPTKL